LFTTPDGTRVGTIWSSSVQAPPRLSVASSLSEPLGRNIGGSDCQSRVLKSIRARDRVWALNADTTAARSRHIAAGSPTARTSPCCSQCIDDLRHWSVSTGRYLASVRPVRWGAVASRASTTLRRTAGGVTLVMVGKAEEYSFDSSPSNNS